MSNPNVLEELVADFNKTSRLKIEVTGISADIYTLPCTLEDKMAIQEIHSETNPKKRAAKLAKFLVSKVELKNGEKAFKNCFNMTAAQAIMTKVKPQVSEDIFLEIAKTGMSDEALEDLEGKLGEQD